MTNHLVLEGIGKRYGNRRALGNVSAIIPKGARVGLVGPNGAGKTTLMSIIAGLIPSHTGSITWGEESVCRYAPQDPVFPRRINCHDLMRYYGRLEGLAGKLLEQEVRRVLDAVSMWDARTLASHALSHGMRKRICIAQSFLCSRPLILLDEPTAGLDPVNAKRVRNAVIAKGPGQTIIVSSHNLDEIQSCCDYVLILADGELMHFGPMSEFTSNRDTLEVVFDAPVTKKVLSGLTSLPHVTSISPSEDQKTVSVAVPSGEQANVMSEILQWGQKNELVIESLRKGVSLTSRFLEKTTEKET